MSFDEEILEAFEIEAKEHLESLEPALLELENSNDDPEIINQIFRAAHSLKGSSGFFGLDVISKLSHAMENVMAKVREGTLAPDKPMIDTLLHCTDVLRQMLDDLENSNQRDTTEEINALNAILGDTPAPAKDASKSAKKQTPKQKASGTPLAQFKLKPDTLNELKENKKNLYLIKINLVDDIQEKGKKLTEFFDEITKIGDIRASQIQADDIQSLESLADHQPIWLHFLFQTIMEPDLLHAVFDMPTDQFEEINKQTLTDTPAPEPPQEPQKDIPTPSPQQETETKIAKVSSEELTERVKGVFKQTGSPHKNELQGNKANVTFEKKTTRKKADETVRVSVSVLDDLMNLAGEMVLGRNQVMRLSTRLQSMINDLTILAGKKRVDPQQLLELAEKCTSETNTIHTSVKGISQVTTELQEKVMRTRLQPVGSLFGKFTRIIRDLARNLGKEIELVTAGEEVELDKSILEGLSDPMTHLIRNCADHAIEPPDEREAKGKPRKGTVRLEASHVGGQVQIKIIDNGRGIDPEIIKSKALSKQIISNEEAERMTDNQAQSLVFAAGFSTAATVSDVSGRGVGMDVVKTNVEKLGGSVELESYVGGGTIFTLRLPLTLAIIPAMCVGLMGRRFAMPQVNLVEIVELNPGHTVETVYETTVLRHRDTLLPIVNLAELLKVQPEPGQEIPSAHKLKGFVLVLKVEEKVFGLLVDSIFNSEEIVVKPLSKYLTRCPCYSGETIMGDGKVIMILDAAGIASYANVRDSYAEQKDTAAEDLESTRRLAETQSILLFRNEGTELFAMNLSMVDHIEEIRPDQIEHVGKKEYLNHEGSSIRLIRLHDFMDCNTPTEDPEILHVIIPKLVTKRMGIVAAKVEDAMEKIVVLDEGTVSGRGILGSCIIDERLIIFIDIYDLFEAAEPSHYNWMKTAASLTGKRILLAEDTAFFRAVGRQYLKEFNCEVDVVNNGLEAWEALNKNTYDMLLTDIEMPGMNGFELAQKVRASRKLHNLPIVVVSALNADHYLQLGEDIGVDAYEVKLDKERMRATLERVFTEYQKKQQKQPLLQ